MNTILANIMTRTSDRKYTSQDVNDSDIETLLRSAMAAPSAGNKQPWRFVVIRDAALREFIASNFPTMTMVRHAPVAIVACGDMKATFDGDGIGYWIQDVSAATENLLLCAHAMGLGAVWCGVYPLPERIKAFSELLHLPEDIVPLNCIAIGHPEGVEHPKDKWNPDFVRRNYWDNHSM